MHRSIPDSARRTAGAPPTATSCLGASRTPAASARGGSRHSGVRETYTLPDSCTAASSRIVRSPRRQGRVASAARQCRARHDCAEHCSGVRGFVVRGLSRRITDARSDASHYATCVGSHRLSEASSEEAKKAEVQLSSPNASCASQRERRLRSESGHLRVRRETGRE